MDFKEKTFNVVVKYPDGKITLEPANQFATFTFVIKQTVFRFVVTASIEKPGVEFTVIFRDKRMTAAKFTYADLACYKNDHKVAGIRAIEKLIARIGEDRVFAVLSGPNRVEVSN